MAAAWLFEIELPRNNFHARLIDVGIFRMTYVHLIFVLAANSTFQLNKAIFNFYFTVTSTIITNEVAFWRNQTQAPAMRCWTPVLWVGLRLIPLAYPFQIAGTASFRQSSTILGASRRSQLRWLMHTALDKLDQEPALANNNNNKALSQALRSLDHAKNVTEVAAVGRQLSSLRVPGALAEEVLQMASIAGLLGVACNLTDTLLQRKLVPSKSSQILLFQSLRKLQRLSKMKHYLECFHSVATDTALHVKTFNIFLAALGESDPPQVEMAWKLLQDSTIYDSVSYSTVLQMAARVHDSSLVDEIWNTQRHRNVLPDQFARDARLKVQQDAARLQLWDQELKHLESLDSYTVDSLLVPFVSEGRSLHPLLDRFCRDQSETTISESFTRFLLTLVEANHLEAAKDLMNTYVLPSLKDVLEGDQLRFVRPDVRHFNAILNGYKDQQESERAWELFATIEEKGLVDSYTLSIMMGLCRDSAEVTRLLKFAVAALSEVSPVLVRAGFKAFCISGDPSSAMWLFVHCASNTKRFWNALLGALACVDPAELVDPGKSLAAKTFADQLDFDSDPDLERFLEPSTVYETVQSLLDAMIVGESAPALDSQTFCVAAMSIQRSEYTSVSIATELFRNATDLGIPADGRFVNSVLRCCKDDVEGALNLWRNEIRPLSIQYERRARSKASKGKHLLAAYNALLYVCGRAKRSNVALRLVYALRKEGLEPNEVCLNSYWKGRLVASKKKSSFVQKLQMVELYESLLYVECTKYNKNDRRRKDDKRVRIII